MLAAISTTTLSRRSCALTGSAITSRSRRNSTRGPPSAPRIAISPLRGPAGHPRIFENPARPRLRDYPMAIANAVCRGQDKAASPRVARRNAAAGSAECIRIDDPAINVANGFVAVRHDVLRCGRAEQPQRDDGGVGGGGAPVEVRNARGEDVE